MEGLIMKKETIKWAVLLVIWMATQGSSYTIPATNSGGGNIRDLFLNFPENNTAKTNALYSPRHPVPDTDLNRRSSFPLPPDSQEPELPIPDSATILFLGIFLLISASAFRNKSIRPPD